MRRPSRRTVLLGACALALPGCLGVWDGDGSPAVDEPSNDFLPDSTDTSAYPGYDADHLVAFDAVDADEASVVLEPTADVVAEAEPFGFTLHNRTAFALEHNPNRWSLHKHVDEEWYYLEPRTVPKQSRRIDPDGSHAWELTVENDAVESGTAIERVDTHGGDPAYGLGGGKYAFATSGDFPESPYDGRVAVAARFELEADPLSVTPTDAVVDTTWEDGDDGDAVLVAESDRGDPDASYTRLGAYEFERVEPTPDSTRLIAETVVRNDQLRDVLALALAEDADRVRLEEHDATTPLFGAREEGIYEYDGTTFEITTRELD